MLTSETGIDLSTWRDDFAKKSGPADLKAMGDFLANSYIPNSVVIDCTASDGPPAMYLDWMKQGLNIITPNKKLGSGPIERYQALRNLQRTSYVHFFYEVGGRREEGRGQQWHGVCVGGGGGRGGRWAWHRLCGGVHWVSCFGMPVLASADAAIAAATERGSGHKARGGGAGQQ
jgi:hypothetical protein